jgi:hypothetical protein
LSGAGLETGMDACQLKAMLIDVPHRVRFRLGVLALGLTLTATPSRAGVVTLITHGWTQDANGWVRSMGRAMAEHPLRKAEFGSVQPATYRLSFNGDRTLKAERIDGASLLESPSGDVFLLLDWNPYSGDLNPFTGATEGTTAIGPLVANGLLAPNLIPELGGPVARWPLHLVGFSRGGSLVCEISKRLGERSVVVDHLTLLDPHPNNNDGFGTLVPTFTFADGTALNGVYQNVLYAECLHQTLFFPEGTPAQGAFVRKLDAWGFNDGGYLLPHEDVHLWYHGTVETGSPITSDGSASFNATTRAKWYAPSEDQGRRAGYHYALRAGGDRRSTFEPVDAASGYPLLGLNQLWSTSLDIPPGDNRARVTVDSQELRANLIEFRLSGLKERTLETNFPAFSSGAFPRILEQTRDTPPDLAATLTYQWSGTGNATLTIFCDTDENSLNGRLTEIRVALPPSGELPRTVRLDLAALQRSFIPGRFRVGALLESPLMIREYYAPERIEVVQAASSLRGARKGTSASVPFAGGSKHSSPTDPDPRGRRDPLQRAWLAIQYLFEGPKGVPMARITTDIPEAGTYVIEASTDLVVWTRISGSTRADPPTAAALEQLIPVQPDGEASRFFRVRSLD